MLTSRQKRRRQQAARQARWQRQTFRTISKAARTPADGSSVRPQSVYEREFHERFAPPRLLPVCCQAPPKLLPGSPQASRRLLSGYPEAPPMLLLRSSQAPRKLLPAVLPGPSCQALRTFLVEWKNICNSKVRAERNRCFWGQYQLEWPG